MKLRVGYELQYHFPQPTPVILMLNIHYTRVSDLERPDHIVIARRCRSPATGTVSETGAAASSPRPGAMRISTDTVISDTGLPDRMAPDATQIPVHELPEEAIVFLLASRYCDSDRLLDVAWTHFAHTQPGWARVQAICDFVHAAHRFQLPARARDAHGLGSL